jgi:hypothetical protein
MDLGISREDLFGNLQDFLEQKHLNEFILMRPKVCPSTINFLLNKLEKYNQLDAMITFCKDNSYYYSNNNSNNIINTNKHDIKFFMHKTRYPELLLYVSAILPPSKSKYLGLPSTAGINKYGYIQAVFNNHESIPYIVNTQSSYKYYELDGENLNDYFIFSKDIIDYYDDWIVNYGWHFGKTTKDTHNKNNFNTWLQDYVNVDPLDDDKRISKKMSDNYPIMNEFLFVNPVSLKFCKYIIISDDKLSNNRTLKFLKRLCPNTFINGKDFLIKSKSNQLNFYGINTELLRLDLDKIYLFLEQSGDLDLDNYNIDILFRTDIIHNDFKFIYIRPDKFSIIKLVLEDVFDQDQNNESKINNVIDLFINKTHMQYYQYIFDTHIYNPRLLIKTGKIDFPSVLIINSETLEYNYIIPRDSDDKIKLILSQYT